jgi:hypothetical protein
MWANQNTRSFGQLVGHVADASYMFCSLTLGDANPTKGIEKTKTSKADLVVALKDAIAYYTKAFDSMTDAKGSQMVKFMNFDRRSSGCSRSIRRTVMSTMETW